MKSWHCNRCGHCCNNNVASFLLRPEEVSLFNQDSVRPAYAFGLFKRRRVVQYQMVREHCEHYQKTTDGGIGQCCIYSNRPLVCRAYPLVLSFCAPNTVVLADCPAISWHRKHDRSILDEETIMAFRDEDTVAKNLVNYYSNIIRERSNEDWWCFRHTDNRWVWTKMTLEMGYVEYKGQRGVACFLKI